MTVYRGNFIWTATPERFEILEQGYVAVDSSGVICHVGRLMPEGCDASEVVDLCCHDGEFVIPAMNDLHVHAPQYRNQGMALDLELLPWLNTYTFPEEQRFADASYAAEVYTRFVHDLWKHGTMRAAVFATIHPEATKMLATLFDKAGMGAYIGLVGMDRNCPDALQNDPQTIEADITGLMRHTEPMPRVSVIVTPRFVPACTPAMLTALGKVACCHHLPVQSHLSENTQEIAWVARLEPDCPSYAHAYDKYGLLGQSPTLMAHCCYSQGVELELLAERGVTIVHCPTSNANLGSGIAPIREFLDRGIRVALGSDVSGGHQLSMFRVMQYAVQMSKLKWTFTDKRLRYLTLSEAFHAATKAGGAFFGKIGSFEPGYAFDALVIDDTALSGWDRHYTILQRLERCVYLADDRHIVRRYCQGREIPSPQA